MHVCKELHLEVAADGRELHRENGAPGNFTLHLLEDLEDLLITVDLEGGQGTVYVSTIIYSISIKTMRSLDNFRQDIFTSDMRPTPLTFLMPFPPPPQDALSMIGYPIFLQDATASSTL